MILSTLDKNELREQRNRMRVTGMRYLMATLFCIVFAAVYEYFSHQVYSDYMIFAFAFPMIGGALPFLLVALRGRNFPDDIAISLYNPGIASLTVGSIMHGVLDIYGTTNSLINVYWIVGTFLTVAGIFEGIRHS